MIIVQRAILIILCLLLVEATYCWSATPPLIISGHPNYPPHMWQQDGELVGIGPNLAKTVCRELGIPFEFKVVNSWNRVQELAQNGKVDLLVGIYSNEERRCYLNYTAAYMQDPTCIFINRNHPFQFSDKNDLIGKRGIAIFGESFGEECDDFMVKHLNIGRVYQAKALFDNLHSARVDYILWGYYPWYLNAKDNNALEWCIPLEPAILTEGMYMAFSRKSSYCHLIPEINKIIVRLQNNGTIDRWREQFLSEYTISTQAVE